MRDSDQKIIKFEYDRNLSNNDFFVSKSNKHDLSDWKNPPPISGDPSK